MSRLADALARAGRIPGPELAEPDGDAECATGDSSGGQVEARSAVAAEVIDEPLPEDPSDGAVRAGEYVPPPEVGGAQAIFQGFASQVSERLVVTESVPMVSLEQYRNLAAVLHHAQVDRGIKVVMVASALAAEGKTLTALNLALTLSGSYHRSVLVIDGDLRQPSMHAIFQVPNTSGLSDAFRSEEPRKVKVFEVSPHLSLLTAGSPGSDPMSLLTSDRIRALLQEAAQRYDWVIVDTPPIGLLTDANLLCAMVDVSVLIVRAGVTPHRLIERAADALGRDRIIGIVLNAVDPGVLAGSRYYPYYYGRRAATA